MPPISAVQASAAALVTSRNAHRPLIAVFFAGATGIGHYALRALARTTADTPQASGFRAYIVARKEQAAREVIAECSAILEGGASGVAVAEPDGARDGDKSLSSEEVSKRATAEFVFLQTSDLSLMSEVDRVCARITELETARAEQIGDVARIDYLLFTQGCAVYQPRKDTKEGLDFTMAMLYYSRMRALTQLLPLLLSTSTASNSATQGPSVAEHIQPQYHAAVISVFAAGIEDPSAFHPANLALDNPTSVYTYNTARSHMVYMHTLFFEYLASHLGSLNTVGPLSGEFPSTTITAEASKLSFFHVFPGLVNGPGFKSPELPSWFRSLWAWIVTPLLGWAVFTRPEVCGVRLLSLADGAVYPPTSSSLPVAAVDAGGLVVRSTTGEIGGGTYALGSSMDDSFDEKKYKSMDREQMRDTVWKHTMGVFETIAKGGVYTGRK